MLVTAVEKIAWKRTDMLLHFLILCILHYLLCSYLILLCKKGQKVSANNTATLFPNTDISRDSSHGRLIRNTASRHGASRHVWPTKITFQWKSWAPLRIQPYIKNAKLRLQTCHHGLHLENWHDLWMKVQQMGKSSLGNHVPDLVNSGFRTHRAVARVKSAHSFALLKQLRLHTNKAIFIT